ncbi:MAG TPA: hypothetical protein VE967_16315 [Gemmatimonadaceae bacterium]|nr:hypothetical protein [Gemmatimonadaceae bacterium]
MSQMTRFGALLGVQWKQQRKELVVLTLLVAMLPSTILWTARNDGPIGPLWYQSIGQSIGAIGAVAAVLIGSLLALRPFAFDAQTRHVYAMTLPVRRRDYSMFRIGTGVVLSLFPTAGVLVGALVAVQALPSGIGLRAFPGGLAARFLLATVTAFAGAFALQYGLGKRATRWALVAVTTIAATELVGQLLLHTSLTTPFFQALVSQWSPLRIFVTRWTLFDV